jgi:phage FluMu protein gp41
MGAITGTLKHGLKVGNEAQINFELHTHLTAGQIMEAKEASEKVVITNINGRMTPVCVESPARLGVLMLCQQIKKIGVIAGPLEPSMFALLHEEDLAILSLYADLADGAISATELSDKLTALAHSASPEVTQKGRSDSSSE